MFHPISLDKEQLRCSALIAFVRAKLGQVRVWFVPTSPWKQTLENIWPERKIHLSFRVYWETKTWPEPRHFELYPQLLQHSENWQNSGGLKLFTSWPFDSRVSYIKISAVQRKKWIHLMLSWILRCLYSIKNSEWLYHKEGLQCYGSFVYQKFHTKHLLNWKPTWFTILGYNQYLFSFYNAILIF